MSVTIAQAQKVLTGNISFSQLGFSLLVTRLRGVYSKNPSQETLKKCTEEINTFLQKFASIMAADFGLISKL